MVYGGVDSMGAPAHGASRLCKKIRVLLFLERLGMALCVFIYIYMGVSINGGTPKWMVYNGRFHSNG